LLSSAWSNDPLAGGILKVVRRVVQKSYGRVNGHSV
jgi:hypothetical protein